MLPGILPEHGSDTIVLRKKGEKELEVEEGWESLGANFKHLPNAISPSIGRRAFS